MASHYFNVIVSLLILTQPILISAQGLIEDARDSFSLNPVQPDSLEYGIRKAKPCTNQFRQLDGTCTHNDSQSTKLWASTNRPQLSYFGLRNDILAIDADIPSPRQISNALSTQAIETEDERSLNELATFFGQFVDHSIVSTPTTKHENMPILIPAADLAGGFVNELPFRRSVRVRISERDNAELPQNSLTSVVDLNSVYGSNQLRSDFLRTKKNGLLRTIQNKFLPMNTDFFNSPGHSKIVYFLAGDHRANENPMLTSLHTLFVREHNDIAAELKNKFPLMDDELLFQNAKKINEVQWQAIVFEKWYPAITGKALPEYTGFNPNINPTVSVLFSTAAFRVGHTLVGDRVNRRGVNNSLLPPIELSSMFFPPPQFIMDSGIEMFLRGAMVSRSQKVDLMVVDPLRNFLFKNVIGESDNFDLVALNLQRGRDHNLPKYNEIREKFGLQKAGSFADITQDISVQSRLREVYETTDKIEAWPGLMAEDHAPGSSLGLTLSLIWETEFTRLRDGDRFYFRNENVIPPDLMQLDRMKTVMNKGAVFSALLLRNSEILVGELPRHVFFTD